MADAKEVLGGIQRHKGIAYAALTPNLKGLEGALAADVNEVAIFASASESFSQKNINCSIEESFERFKPVLEKAYQNAIPVRGYLSCVVQCPYEGAIAPEIVAELSQRLLALGCYEISLGDTIGAGTPKTIANMLEAVLSHIPAPQLAGHYHDTNGRALENIETSLNLGLRTFDSAVGGLGGCPYAQGATGNVATESVVALLDQLGYQTNIDKNALANAAQFAKALRTRGIAFEFLTN